MSRIAKRIIRLLASIFFRAKPMDKDQMKEIWKNAKVCCVLCASGIGDSVMATPLIKKIRYFKPEMKLIVIGTETTTQVFKTNPVVDVIMKYNSELSIVRFILFLLRLHHEKIDVLFAAQPANTIRHSLIAAFSGAKMRLKHEYDYGESTEREFFFVYNTLLPDRMERHRVELNLDFLRYFGEIIDERSVYPKYYISQNAQQKIEKWLISVGNNENAGKLIAVHPGGVRENKRWMPERFAEVGRELIKYGYSICLVGGREEEPLCRKIENSINMQNRVINTCGVFSLEETAALLKKCLFLLCNDTGIMHLATAVGAHVIAIFGPTDYRHIGPFSRKARIFYKSPNIKDITATEVLNTVLGEIRIF
ncbi:MAG: hypothetical protein A2163_08215 [Actinobacteria bacterium RBG_13_35_12]|nr:MAG: hypothetical protein A2163_08215 [Actinobacteria bacterium RBG_13_35_12]